jgi:hypothetical protein
VASYATTIQLVESDRLSNPAGVQDSKTCALALRLMPMVQRWRTTSAKRIQAMPISAMGMESDDWLRIPVRTAFGRMRVLHVHDKERTGQHRGKPLLTSHHADVQDA